MKDKYEPIIGGHVKLLGDKRTDLQKIKKAKRLLASIRFFSTEITLEECSVVEKMATQLKEILDAHKEN